MSAAAAAPGAGAAQTWSALMYRGLNPGDQAARLQASLPGLRSTVAARARDLDSAQQGQSAAAERLSAATAADTYSQSSYAAAEIRCTHAREALTAVASQRPVSRIRIARARRELKVATNSLQSRSEAATAAGRAIGAARAAYQQASQQVAAASGAWQAATLAVSDTEQKIAGLPMYDPKLTAQAAAISQKVVTEARATFTAADTCRVYGITVNKTIAYPLQRMIEDAHNDGIELSGSGLRTEQQQIQLRVTNGCPDIWTAPASSCKVPTAIPGRSLHEIGLAVDLTCANKLIKDRNSPAFRWLVAHAGRYGFTNLPSEPWHWSITGN